MCNTTSEIKINARQSPSPNLRFIGPVLVRSEPGYHVLRLPMHVKLVIGDLAKEDGLFLVHGGAAHLEEVAKSQPAELPAKK